MREGEKRRKDLEKTREERDAELRGEAVSLDNFGGMRGVELAARHESLGWRASVN